MNLKTVLFRELTVTDNGGLTSYKSLKSFPDRELYRQKEVWGGGRGRSEGSHIPEITYQAEADGLGNQSEASLGSITKPHF